MTPPHAQSASAARSRADVAARAEPAGSFVVNLCSSTTPMALFQPQDPELKRFAFFVSRRLEDGRERFRLHMGYFGTLQEAEEWVAVVREFYPGAWAGETPGKRLHAREQAVAAAVPAPMPASASAVPAVPAAPAQSLQVVPPAAAGSPQIASAPAAERSNVREVLASLDETGVTREMPVVSMSLAHELGQAREAAQAQEAAHAQKAAQAQEVAQARAQARAPAQKQERMGQPELELEPAPSRKSARGQEPRPEREPEPEPEHSLSDTQVLTLLESRRADGERAEPDRSIVLLRPDDTGTRRALKEAVAANVPVSFAVQLQWSVQPIEVAQVPPLAIFSAYTLYTVEGSREGRRWYGLRLGFFSDAISAKQVAHYVRSEFNSVAVVPVSPHERGRASDTGESAGTSPGASTGTVTGTGASASAGPRGAAVPASSPSSARPSASPPLGARSSASPNGGPAAGARSGASPGGGPIAGARSSASPSADPAAGARSSPGASASKTPKPPTTRSPVRDRLPEPTTEFKLFDEEPPAPRDPAQKMPAAKMRAAAPAKRAAKGPAGRVRARDKRSPQTLEETLEILGADQLEIEDRRSEIVSSNGVRPLRTPERKSSPFTRLLDRLAERSRRDR